MKRLMQAWMVAVALLVGAQAANADPITGPYGYFTWSEELDFGLVNFRFTSQTTSTISNLTVKLDKVSGSPVLLPFTVLVLPTVLAFDDRSVLASDYPDGSVIAAETIQELTVSLVVDNLLLLHHFVRSDLSSGALPGDLPGDLPSDLPSASWTFYSDDAVAQVPEPTLLGLTGLCLAAAALARRHRRR